MLLKEKPKLTRNCADVVEIKAAAASGATVGVASAARDLVVKGLVTSVSAGRLGGDWKTCLSLMRLKARRQRCLIKPQLQGLLWLS